MKKVIKDTLLKKKTFLEKLHELHNHLPFLPERMKIENIKKLVAHLHDKKHKKFQTGIKSWITLEKVHRVIKFKQHAWLKPYIDMNTDLKKAKNDSEKYFS